MNVDVFVVPELVNEEDLADKTVIVLDILRATTTMVTALKNGCSEIYPVFTVEDAWHMADDLDRDEVLLGGERKIVKIDKFDFGNSPLEYIKDKVQYKKIIITTTNGTKTIVKTKNAKQLLIGSFLNSEAAVDKALSEGNDIIIACAGTDGRISTEDLCCAGLMVDQIVSKTDTDLTDSSICARELYVSNKDKLEELLSKTRHYNILKQNGFFEDVRYSLQVDITDIVPIYKRGKIILGE